MKDKENDMENLKNYVKNMKELMIKVQGKEKLTADDRKKLVQFYLEVTYVVFEEK
jgi:hypothetical protein